MRLQLSSKVLVLYDRLMDDLQQNRSNTLGVTDSPHHGPTLSTSTSSFEALETYDSELSRLATKAFEKTYTYVTHDMNASLDDYKLLEQMNRACISKYSDMQQISENLATSSVQLKEKFDNLVRTQLVYDGNDHKSPFIRLRFNVFVFVCVCFQLATLFGANR